MRISVFTHADHKFHSGKLYSYEPYVNEINLWIKFFDEVRVISPLTKGVLANNESYYRHKNIKNRPVHFLYFKRFTSFFISCFWSIQAVFRIFGEMRKADHIHIRCPGNIGLLACIVQILFPHKKKTVKYAGNWDPDSQQPWTYRLQKSILKNEFLSKNIIVLIYGEWEKENSRNLKSFFTASFSKKEVLFQNKRIFEPPFKFIFLGSLVTGKRPLMAVKIIEKLRCKGFEVSLDIYGDGEKRGEIETYIEENELKGVVNLHGNKDKSGVMHALRNAHFVILPSKSEGWPKALAEGMFYGAIPIATKISCVGWMLGEGSRGILIEPEVESASNKISSYLANREKLEKLSANSQSWSQKYTLEKFENAIQEIL